MSLIEYLKRFPGADKLSFEIRYVFYKMREGEKIYFTALHGGGEARENLVQMLIRDNYAEFYHPYLLERAKSDAPWEELARKVGMIMEGIQTIRGRREEKGGALVQQEYEYVAETHKIYDGSPTFVWEGERVKDIRQVEAFKRLDFKASGECAGE